MDGQRLKMLRLARGLSLDDLAEAAGAVVSARMLSRYERGLSTPAPRIALGLARALDVSASRLLAPEGLTRDERRQMLAQSVSVSATEYEPDREWLDAVLDTPPRTRQDA